MSLLDVGGVLYFVAEDRPSGADSGRPMARRREPSLSDTAQLDSFPHGLIVLGGRLFFVADDGISGQELWALDLA